MSIPSDVFNTTTKYFSGDGIKLSHTFGSTVLEMFQFVVVVRSMCNTSDRMWSYLYPNFIPIFDFDIRYMNSSRIN
jgi:hypothetical protein